MDWTDEMVEVFTQIYSSNYSPRCVQKFEKKYKIEFKYSDFTVGNSMKRWITLEV